MKVGEIWIRTDDKFEATIDSIGWWDGEHDNDIGFHYGNNPPKSCCSTRNFFVSNHIIKRNTNESR